MYRILPPIAALSMTPALLQLMPRRRPLQTDDGWSHVISPRKFILTPKAVAVAGRKKDGRPDMTSLVESMQAHSPAPTADEYRIRFERAIAEVRAVMEQGDSPFEPILQALGEVRISIREIVALGLGSLHGPTAGSSWLQLALAVVLQETVREGHIGDAEDGARSEPKLLLSDPVFSDSDTTFLSSLPSTFVVAASANGPPNIKVDTLLYAPHLPFAILRPILKQAEAGGPAVLICNDLRIHIDVLALEGKAGSEIEDLERFLRGEDGTEEGTSAYREHLLAGLDTTDSLGGGRAFNHQSVYCKPHR